MVSTLEAAAFSSPKTFAPIAAASCAAETGYLPTERANATSNTSPASAATVAQASLLIEGALIVVTAGYPFPSGFGIGAAMRESVL